MKDDASIAEVLDSIFSKISNTAMSGLDRAVASWREKNHPIPARDPRLVDQSPRVEGLANVHFGIGLALSICSGLTALAILLDFKLGNLPLFFVLLAFCIGGLFLIHRSKYYKDANIRLGKYLRALEKGTVAQVDHMARLAGVSPDLVVQDLESFIRDNTFKEAQLVENKQLFILDYSSYRLYEKQVDRLENLDKEKLAEGDDEDYVKGKEIFRKIKASYPLLRKEGQGKILPLITTIQRIYEHVDAYPENRGALGKFSSYYIPSCKDLVDRYLLLQESEELNQSSQALRALEQSFLEINGAFEELLDNLGGSMARDTLSEVSVLKSLMKQDGLLDRDFEMEDSHGGKRN